MRSRDEIQKIDLHMHTVFSDGTDSPEELLAAVRSAGIDLFSVSDHDAIGCCEKIREILSDSDPLFISGVEFSCKDTLGKYHILGYGYDESAPAIRTIVNDSHVKRIRKMRERLEILSTEFGFAFRSDDIEELFQNNNPGKPHLARLMVEYKYALSTDLAFSDVLNRVKIPGIYIRPEEAIRAIQESGGVPVLAHPSFGSGSDNITGTDMEDRLKRLMNFGLEGVEAYYSGFTPELQSEMLGYAEKYGLYVTAGSDYHGKNKRVLLGENHLDDLRNPVPGLSRFLERILP